MVRDLRWASATIETPLGEASCSWRRSEDAARLEIEIPVGATAEIHVPKLRIDDPVITEGGNAVWKGGSYHSGVAGIIGARAEAAKVIIRAGSGRYSFQLAAVE